jgi:hypothetical protein
VHLADLAAELHLDVSTLRDVAALVLDKADVIDQPLQPAEVARLRQLVEPTRQKGKTGFSKDRSRGLSIAVRIADLPRWQGPAMRYARRARPLSARHTTTGARA